MKVTFRRRLLKQRRFRQLLVALLILAILLGFAIVPVESKAANAHIHTWFDGVYWSVTTLTTVGYGDIVPVTVTGRVYALGLQLIGAIMFGLIIAMISSYVNRAQDEFYWNRLFERMDRMEEELNDIKKKNDYLVKDNTQES